MLQSHGTQDSTLPMMVGEWLKVRRRSFSARGLASPWEWLYSQHSQHSKYSQYSQYRRSRVLSQEFFQSTRLSLDFVRFDGGHTIPPSVLSRFQQLLHRRGSAPPPPARVIRCPPRPLVLPGGGVWYQAS